MQPLYRVITQRRASGEIHVSVRFSPTLRYLPAPDRQREIEEASWKAHEKVVEAFETVA